MLPRRLPRLPTFSRLQVSKKPVVPRLTPAALEALKTRAFEAASLQMRRSLDLSTCFEVAYAAPERQKLLAGNAVQRWAAQEPLTVSGMLAGVGAADAADVVRFVVMRMPGRLIEECAAIRRESEE